MHDNIHLYDSPLTPSVAHRQHFSKSVTLTAADGCLNEIQ